VSGQALKEFRGHHSFINSVKYGVGEAFIASACSDGTTKIWDVQTTHCTTSIVPAGQITTNATSGSTMLGVAVMAAHPRPGHFDQLIICTKSPELYLVQIDGTVLRKFSCGDEDLDSGGIYDVVPREFLTCCISRQGKYLYAVHDDNKICIFDIESGQMNKVLEVSNFTLLVKHDTDI